MSSMKDQEILERLTTFRQYQHNGDRVPHKPLLVLMALGELSRRRSSDVTWSDAEERLADLIGEFGPPTLTGRSQAAAYPFTRLRADGIWTLDADVPDDRVKPLRDSRVVGRFEPSLEMVLRD